MLQPARTKFRKQHKGRIHGAAKAGTSLNFGAYGLKATEPERITAREIEAARRAITRHMKRAGRVACLRARDTERAHEWTRITAEEFVLELRFGRRRTRGKRDGEPGQQCERESG